MTTWLDNAATTRPAPDVLEAMRPWQGERWGNPSSSHGPGVRAAEAVAEAAREVAALIPGGSWDVIFTSGGTEANALAVLGTGRRGGIVTTDVEHPSVLGNVALLESAGSEVARVGAGPAARVDPGRMAGAIGAGTRLVSISPETMK